MRIVMTIGLVMVIIYGIFLSIDHNIAREYIVEACILGAGLIVFVLVRVYRSLQIEETRVKIQFLDD